MRRRRRKKRRRRRRRQWGWRLPGLARVPQSACLVACSDDAARAVVEDDLDAARNVAVDATGIPVPVPLHRHARLAILYILLAWSASAAAAPSIPRHGDPTSSKRSSVCHGRGGCIMGDEF